jgi:hypothetical protein
MIAVINRKDDVLNQLNTEFPSVSNIFYPDVQLVNGDINLIMRKL